MSTAELGEWKNRLFDGREGGEMAQGVQGDEEVRLPATLTVPRERLMWLERVAAAAKRLGAIWRERGACSPTPHLEAAELSTALNAEPLPREGAE